MRIDDLPRITASHLVKSVDLNHHGTLFAGRMAEWLVETAFMAARAALGCAPENLVCISLHGMDFRRSVEKGATLILEGSTAHVGRTSITIHVAAAVLESDRDRVVGTEGFATFVHVVEGRAVPHEIDIAPPETPEAQRRWDQVVAARQRRRRAG